MSQETQMFYYNHNVTATTYAWGRFLGPFQGNGNLNTSGSSATVNAVGGGLNYALAPFQNVAGDLIVMHRSDTLIDRTKVATKASATQITVATAVNWDNSGAGYGAWEYWKFNSGTADTDGWIDCKRFRRKTISINIASLGETNGIAYRVQGLQYGPQSLPIFLGAEVTVAQAAAPYSIDIILNDDVQGVRFGMKRVTATTGTDVINVQFVGDPVGAGVAR